MEIHRKFLRKHGKLLVYIIVLEKQKKDEVQTVKENLGLFFQEEGEIFDPSVLNCKLNPFGH